MGVPRVTAALLVVVLLAFDGVRVAAYQDPGPEPAGPDVIVVMVDDLGAIDERILRRLPNIEALWLDEGLRFDAAYSETPLCCPGRAAFLTGQHTRRHKVVKNRATLLNPSHTLATLLDDAGYWTAMVGKYFNHSEKLADKSPLGWDRVALRNVSTWWVDDVATTPRGHADRFLMETAVAWLEEAPSGPVFMWLTPLAPHWSGSQAIPWQPAVERRYARDKRCSGIKPWKPPSYAYIKQPGGFPLGEICRSLLTVDEMVGALQAEMKAQGRKPYWVFTSDNGMAWGAKGFPLKNVPEAGRLPLYFAGPGVVKGSTRALVSNIDIGPTIAALAGTAMPRADGISFAGLLKGGSGGREWMLEDHPLGGYTAGPWRGGWWGVRTPEWHLVRIKKWQYRLYNVTSDPWELKDVRAGRRAVVQRLKLLGVPLLVPID